MTRLRQPDDSHYDVLGVAPHASDKEINSAFRRLIDGGGYKVGVPLNRQWLRARQIKEAYATLGDPAMRRAYDESLGRTPEPAPQPAPWAMTASDPATDELVLREKEPEPPEPIKMDSPPDASIAEDAALTASSPEPAADEAPGPDAEAIDPLVDESPLPIEPDPTANDNESDWDLEFNENKRAPARKWAMAAAAAAGLGLVMLSSPWEWTRRPTSESAPGVAAPAGQAGAAGEGFVHQVLGNIDRALSPNPQPQRAPAGAMPAALVAGASEQATSQNVGQLAANGVADVRSQSEVMSTGATPGEAPPPAMEAAEARATAPAPTPPVATVPAIATAPPAGAESSGNEVHTPAQWIGGGPTDADNRKGRYQGALAVQIVVEPDGRVSRCAPVRGSGNAGLDELTCRLVRERARFSPALDAQGRPVASQTYTTFVWGRNRRR